MTATDTASSPRHSQPRHGRPRDRVSTAAGYIGELLVALGILVGLYVVWQLFYTDVQADRIQQGVIDGIEWNVGVPLPSERDDSIPVIPPELQFRDGNQPVMDEPSHGTTFAVFHVPRWGQDYAKPISQGITRRDVLDVLGIGHYPGTAMPGGFGNFAIAGHRTSYGKPFSQVDELQRGDALVVQTEEAWYVYRVTDWSIVLPRQTEVIAPTPGAHGSDPSGYFITLTTCHPRYSAAQRWVVHGELDYWAPTGHGLPPELLEDLA